LPLLGEQPHEKSTRKQSFRPLAVELTYLPFITTPDEHARKVRRRVAPIKVGIAFPTYVQDQPFCLDNVKIEGRPTVHVSTPSILLDWHVAVWTSASNLDLELLGRVELHPCAISPLVIIGTRLSLMPSHTMVHADLILAYMTLQLHTAEMELSGVALGVETEVEVV
jgi:hypothetical protein